MNRNSQINEAIRASYVLYLDTINMAHRLYYDLSKVDIDENYSDEEYLQLTDNSNVALRNQAQFKKFLQLDKGINVYASDPIAQGLKDYKQKLEERHQFEEGNDTLESNIFIESNTIYNHLKSDEHCEYICQDTIDYFTNYIKKYDIKSNSVDTYKIRYFMGISIIKNLRNSKYNTLSLDIARLMLLGVMQRTLFEDHNEGLSDDMFKKFAITLLEDLDDPIKEYFGKFGLYLIFKSIYKVIKI
jgi:hypothetical protein